MKKGRRSLLESDRYGPTASTLEKLEKLAKALRAHADGSSVGNDFMSVDAAADLTGWSTATLYSKSSRRQIPSYRIGRSLRFRRTDLLRLFEARPALRPLHAPLDEDRGDE